MGVFFRPRRPLMRVATGAATAAVAYNAGRRHSEQQQVNEQAEAAYSVTKARTAEPPAPDSIDRLERLATLHDSGALTDTVVRRQGTAARRPVMTPAELIGAAITATAVGDITTINELYAADCSGTTPTMRITSRAQLIDEVGEQAGVLSDVTVEVRPAETSNGTVAAEWRLTGRHTGALVVDDEHVPPTGSTVALHGAIFVTVTGGRIRSFRQYWSEVDLLEQLGLLEAIS